MEEIFSFETLAKLRSVTVRNIAIRMCVDPNEFPKRRYFRPSNLIPSQILNNVSHCILPKTALFRIGIDNAIKNNKKIYQKIYKAAFLIL
jgi:hypothetical protein